MKVDDSARHDAFSSKAELCEICMEEVRTMCWLGTGVCGETHRKVRDEESTVPHTPKKKPRRRHA